MHLEYFFHVHAWTLLRLLQSRLQNLQNYRNPGWWNALVINSILATELYKWECVFLRVKKGQVIERAFEIAASDSKRLEVSALILKWPFMTAYKQP